MQLWGKCPWQRPQMALGGEDVGRKYSGCGDQQHLVMEGRFKVWEAVHTRNSLSTQKIPNRQDWRAVSFGETIHLGQFEWLPVNVE